MEPVWSEIAALAHGARTFHRMAMFHLREGNWQEYGRLRKKAWKWLEDAQCLKALATDRGVPRVAIRTPR